WREIRQRVGRRRYARLDRAVKLAAAAGAVAARAREIECRRGNVRAARGNCPARVAGVDHDSSAAHPAAPASFRGEGPTARWLQQEKAVGDNRPGPAGDGPRLDWNRALPPESAKESRLVVLHRDFRITRLQIAGGIGNRRIALHG